jgi:hypothetical protein
MKQSPAEIETSEREADVLSADAFVKRAIDGKEAVPDASVEGILGDGDEFTVQ